MPRTKKKRPEVKPIKKVPLITSIVFLGIGILNLILAIISSDTSAKTAYAAIVATFVTLGQ